MRYAMDGNLKKMSRKSVLVLWIRTKKKNVVDENVFEKRYKTNGKILPLREGDVRSAVIEGKKYQAKILRISASKKYLESLLVTKEGEVLQHGIKHPSKDLLAKRSRLVTDETEEQKAARNILLALNAIAEEQPPDIRLGGSTNCNHGCSKCCQELPSFPKLPEGFVKTLLSLADYFQHFHKSTAANILAAGAALTNLAGKLQAWQMPSEKKRELKKGSGVWIEAIHLQKIVSAAEQTKKPPHLVVVKGLLTHLLGLKQYLELSAERIDRRLMSGVVGFANERYPALAQPIERYYRNINLNRGYLQRKKDEMPLISETQQIKRLEQALNLYGDLPPKRAKVSSESKSATLISPNISSVQNSSATEHYIIDLETETPNVSSNNVNKVIVLRRPAPNTENAQTSAVYSTPQQSLPLTLSSNIAGSVAPNILVSSNRSNVQELTLPGNIKIRTEVSGNYGTNSLIPNLFHVTSSVPGNLSRNSPFANIHHVASSVPSGLSRNSPYVNVHVAGSVPSSFSRNSPIASVHVANSVPSGFSRNTPIATVHVASSVPSSFNRNSPIGSMHVASSVPSSFNRNSPIGSMHVASSLTSSMNGSAPLLTSANMAASSLRATTLQSAFSGFQSPKSVLNSSGNVVTTSIRPSSVPPGSVPVLVNTHRSFPNNGNVGTSSIRSHSPQAMSTLFSGSQKLVSTGGVVNNAIRINSPQTNAPTIIGHKSLPNTRNMIVQQSTSQPSPAVRQSTVTTFNQHGSFKFSAPSTSSVRPVHIKSEKDIEIEGALNFTL